MSSDPFDSVLNLESQFLDSGWEEGLKAGEKAGYLEGFSLGVEKGFEVAKEIGFYKGCLIAWTHVAAAQTQETPSSKTKALGALESLLSDFPLENPQEENLFELLEKIRAKFKLLNSLMGTHLKYSATPVLNF